MRPIAEMCLIRLLLPRTWPFVGASIARASASTTRCSAPRARCSKPQQMNAGRVGGPDLDLAVFFAALDVSRTVVASQLMAVKSRVFTFRDPRGEGQLIQIRIEDHRTASGLSPVIAPSETRRSEGLLSRRLKAPSARCVILNYRIGMSCGAAVGSRCLAI
jgi:hypothetical protein